MRVWFGSLVVLFACGRSELGSNPSALVADGGRDASSVDAAAVEPEAVPPARMTCPAPDAPISLPAGCVEAMCACDRKAYLDCDWTCWTKVACRVATCFNNPTNIDCAVGCPNSSEGELSLGRCYEASRACTGR